MFNNLKKILIAVIAIMIVTTGMFAGFFTKSKTVNITLTGSTTVLPIAQACAEEYMNKNKNVKITVNGGGSSNGIKAIIDGTAEIGDASRLAKQKEIDLAKSKGLDLYNNIVALDGIAVVSNVDVKGVDSLTIEQVMEIFTGKISNWKELGGPDAEIVVISRDTSSGTYGSFVEMALEKEKMRADAQMVASNQAMATTVAKTPYSIGYIGLGYMNSADIKPIMVNGISPSEKTVKDGSYPISRSLNMYTNGAPSGEVKKFIDYILSSKGQAIVEKTGFIKL